MKAKEFYISKGNQFKELLAEHQYRSLLKWTEEYAKLKTKELIEENSRMKLQLNDDGDLPPVNIEGEKIVIIKAVYHRIKTK